MGFLRDLFAALGSALLAMLAPLVPILLGAGLAAWGLTSGWPWLIWTGLIVAAAGVVWGLVVWLAHGGAD